MFYALLLTYVLGGVTFIPLLVVAAICVAVYTENPICQLVDLKPTYAKVAQSSTVDTKTPTLKTWLTVRRTYEASPSTYMAFVRGLLDARSSNPRRAEDSYYSVLKGNVLYLYEDEAMSECAAAIDVSGCNVRVYPDDGLLDGELFAKRNAIIVTENVGEAATNKDEGSEASISPPPWYIFFRSVTVMEDWYLSLLAAQDPTPPPYPHDAHMALISSLDALPDLIPTRWLNAIIGRLFLAVKGTTALEAWVIGRLMKKLSKVKTPGFLTSVVIRSFEAGDVAPVFSKPMLKELTPEGETSIGVDVLYVAPPGGEMRLTVSATATIALPTTPSLSILGFSGRNKEKETADKPYEVSLVLAVVLRKLSGNILLKIKRPPSNRLWYAFTTMPQMEMVVEPVVSDRQIRWSMVLSVIESKLREVIQESVVLPYMDDIPFFDTTAYDLRGGIFAEAFSRTTATTTTATNTGTKTNAMPSLVDTNAEASKESNNAKEAAELPIDAEGESILLGRVESLNAGSANRRRTWFGRKGDDGETQISGSGSASASTNDHRRVKSHDVASVNGEASRSDPEVSLETPTPTPSSPIRRSHSQGSRVVSDGEQSSSLRPPSPTENSSKLSRSLPSPSPMPSNALSTPQSPQPTSSFLTALKSRSAVMAEKQPALKAIRNWGVSVNWAQGLRKTDKEKEKHGRERERDKERGDWDAESDHGLLWGSDAATKDSSSRESYAELRKKVELREKARVPREGSITNNDQAASSPIDIPGSDSKTKMDSSIMTQESSSSKSSLAHRSHSSISSQLKISPPGNAPFLTPSAPRTTTEVHTTIRPNSPIALPTSPLPADDPERTRGRSASPHSTQDRYAHTPPPPVISLPPTPTPAVPIRAQPRAATMTIPGIHASHRGEVMALGSEPEPPKSSDVQQPQQPPIPAKAIQNVYKLFRGRGEGVRNEHDVRPKESNHDSSSSTPALPATPPPLPPRSQTQTDVTPSSLKGERKSHSWDNKEQISSQPTLSPASQALKHVAEQDAARKPPPPPLPVRRPGGTGPPSPAPSLTISAESKLASSSSPSLTRGSQSPSPVRKCSSVPLQSQSEEAGPEQSQPNSMSPSSRQLPGDAHCTNTLPMATNGHGEKWRPPLPPRRGTDASDNHDVRLSVGLVQEPGGD